MPIITPAQIHALAPHARPDITRGFCDHADDVLPRYGMATRARLVDFMAHVLEETGGFTVLEENLNYTAERAHEVWPSRFPTAAAAAPVAHNPQALANAVYGGRMGNVQPGDGWRFRGQGPLQNTGRTNCELLATAMHRTVDDVLGMLTSEAGMLECAVAIYVRTGAPKFADRGDIAGSTRAVNGGSLNLATRTAYREKCRAVWPDELVVPKAMSRIPAPAEASKSGGKIDMAPPCTRPGCPLAARAA